MLTLSSTLAWEIPWMLGTYQATVHEVAGHNFAIKPPQQHIPISLFKSKCK